VLRVASHVAVVIPFAYGTIRTFARGWVPLGDTATIALRSWEVFGAYAPLVGQRTGLANTYDLGPLEYWLLSVPTRIDPQHGVLWGASLWAIVAAWLAIEAARRAFGLRGCVLASALIVAAVAWAPQSADVVAWNPRLGMMWFFAVLTGACAVYRGNRQWWPVLVLTASIAMQSHLMFAVTSFVLVVVTGIMALRSARRDGGNYRFAIVGVAIAVACWIGPLIQEFTHHPGNMTLLLTKSQGGRDLGAIFGLKTFIATVIPPALWWRDLQGANPHHVLQLVDDSYFPLIVVALAVVIGPFFVGRRYNSEGLRAVSLVSIVSCVGLALTFAELSRAGTAAITWMIDIVFPIGIISWIAMIWAAYLLLKARPPTQPGRDYRALYLRASKGVAAGLALLGAVTVVSVVEVNAGISTAYSWQLIPVVSKTSAAIERTLPPGPVYIHVKGNISHDFKYSVTEALAYQLQQAGYHPEVSGFPALAALGGDYGPTHLASSVLVDVTQRRGGTSVTTRFHKHSTIAKTS
jgi:hypothetical protein